MKHRAREHYQEGKQETACSVQINKHTEFNKCEEVIKKKSGKNMKKKSSLDSRQETLEINKY